MMFQDIKLLLAPGAHPVEAELVQPLTSLARDESKVAGLGGEVTAIEAYTTIATVWSELSATV